MLVAWGQKLTDEFIYKCAAICKDFDWHTDQINDLTSCIAFETGETFSPTIRNAAGSGAIGLIQFMPSTAHALGTSTQGLSQLSAVAQLDYVQKYFRPYAHKIKTIDDMYMAILMPRYIDADDDKPIFIDPSIAYRQNAGLDTNKDGHITKAEITLKIRTKRSKGLLVKNARNILISS